MNVFRNLGLTAVLAIITIAFAGQTARAADDHSHGPESAAHADAGDPKLLQGFNQGVITAITTLVIFVVLVAVLGKFAWGPIAKGLQDREDKIRKDIDQAEAARKSAEDALKEYQAKLASAQAEMRKMLDQAAKDAEGVAAGIKVKAQQESEEIKERALKDIDASKNAALSEIHDHAATLATNVAEKILRRQINENDQKALVQSSLEQLQSLARN
jgi:F-type H+-transporting ATPase subunit b